MSVPLQKLELIMEESLHGAARSGNTEMISRVISHPYFILCFFPSTLLLWQLLAAGSDANEKDKLKRSPLHLGDDCTHALINHH